MSPTFFALGSVHVDDGSQVATREHVEIKGLKEVMRDIDQMIMNVEDIKIVHGEVALHVLGWQQRHISRDKANRFGIKWPQHSALTRAIRGNSAKLLEDKGGLKQAIHGRARSNTGWIVETRKKYAAIHQHGGDIVAKNPSGYLWIPLGKGKRTRGAGGRFVAGKSKGFVKLKKVTIPKREFMYLTGDEEQMMVDHYASELATRKTKFIDWKGKYKIPREGGLL